MPFKGVKPKPLPLCSKIPRPTNRVCRAPRNHLAPHRAQVNEFLTNPALSTVSDRGGRAAIIQCTNRRLGGTGAGSMADAAANAIGTGKSVGPGHGPGTPGSRERRMQIPGSHFPGNRRLRPRILRGRVSRKTPRCRPSPDRRPGRDQPALPGPLSWRGMSRLYGGEHIAEKFPRPPDLQ